MTSYTILLDGDLYITERLLRFVQGGAVIAADGAIRFADALGVTPALWIGDFDSSDSVLKDKYKNIKHIKYPVAKDKTDGELAVETALDMGADRLILCGALGGRRTDHALFHMTYALSLAEKGIEVILTSGREEAYPILSGAYSFDLPIDSIFSIIGLTELKALTLRGCDWPLENKDVEFGSSLTLSNRVCGTFQLNLGCGKAMLLASLPVKS